MKISKIREVSVSCWPFRKGNAFSLWYFNWMLVYQFWRVLLQWCPKWKPIDTMMYLLKITHNCQYCAFWIFFLPYFFLFTTRHTILSIGNCMYFSWIPSKELFKSTRGTRNTADSHNDVAKWTQFRLTSMKCAIVNWQKRAHDVYLTLIVGQNRSVLEQPLSLVSQEHSHT